MPIKRPRQIWGWDTDNSEHVKLFLDSNGRMKLADILREYAISDQDSSNPGYYGYLREDGAWYIVEQTTSGVNISFRYAKGADSYNWATRTGGTYNLFNVEFGY